MNVQAGILKLMQVYVVDDILLLLKCPAKPMYLLFLYCSFYNTNCSQHCTNIDFSQCRESMKLDYKSPAILHKFYSS